MRAGCVAVVVDLEHPGGDRRDGRLAQEVVAIDGRMDDQADILASKVRPLQARSAA